MRDRICVTILVAMLAANLAALAGFLWVRHQALPRTGLDALAAGLDLSALERAALVELRRAALATVRDAGQANRRLANELAVLAVSRAPDDPELLALADQAATQRGGVQRALVQRIAVFASGLDDGSQRRLRAFVERRGALIVLLGVEDHDRAAD